jgi:hypothetical protein
VPAAPDIDGAVFEVEDPADGAVTVTPGPVLSTVQLAVAALLAFPAASYDTTVNVWEPLASPLYVAGLEHTAGVAGTPSSRQPKETAVGSALLNESVAEL